VVKLQVEAIGEQRSKHLVPLVQCGRMIGLCIHVAAVCIHPSRAPDDLTIRILYIALIMSLTDTFRAISVSPPGRARMATRPRLADFVGLTEATSKAK
jgi:hypothetical protein